MFSNRRFSTLLLGGALVLGAWTLAGCGHKGSPKPPPQKIPQHVTDLLVAQRGDQIRLFFTYPQVTVSGLPIEDIVAIELWEYTMPVPEFRSEALGEEEGGAETEGASDAEGAEEGESVEGEPESASEASESDAVEGEDVEAAEEAAGTPEPRSRKEPMAGPQSTGPDARTGVIDDPSDLAKLGEIGATIDAALGEPSAGATTGDEDEDDEEDSEEDLPEAPSISKEALLEVDPRQFVGASRLRASLTGTEITSALSGDKVKMTIDLDKIEPGETEALVFGVKSFQTLRRASGFSNLVKIIPRVTPDPPSELEAIPTSSGVRLNWTFEGEEPEEFRIYRRDRLQPTYDLHLGARPGDGDQFLDSTAGFGGTYVYVVTAVVNRVPLVESDFSEELEVNLVDEFAPDPPTDLVVFAEEGRARLLWDAPDDEDLDGYFIYRKEADGEFVRLNDKPQRRTDFTDSEAASGRRYTYRVVAVDRTGNIGEPSEEVETRIP